MNPSDRSISFVEVSCSALRPAAWCLSINCPRVKYSPMLMIHQVCGQLNLSFPTTKFAGDEEPFFSPYVGSLRANESMSFKYSFAGVIRTDTYTADAAGALTLHRLVEQSSSAPGLKIELIAPEEPRQETWRDRPPLLW